MGIIITEAVLRMSRGGYSVEFHLQSDDVDGNGMTINEVETFLTHAANNGYEPQYNFKKNEKQSLEHKVGSVMSVMPGKKTSSGNQMYEVTGTLDDGGAEFKWNCFKPTEFRRGDRFMIVRGQYGLNGVYIDPATTQADIDKALDAGAAQEKLAF